MALTGIKRLSIIGGFREREAPAPVEDEAVFFENAGGSVGLVELTGDGGVFLTLDQLRLFKERDGMKGCSVKRQEDGRYLVNVRKYNPNEKIDFD